MKLDKVGCPPEETTTTRIDINVSRMPPVPSTATSSSPSRRCLPTRSPHGASPLAHLATHHNRQDTHIQETNERTLIITERMIAIFDEDGGGDVDFQEFVSGLSAFSSKGNKEEKLRFAFKVYDIDRDGYISNGELFIVLKMMVGNNLKDVQLQQIVDKTIMEADKDRDGKISFEEFTDMVENTDVSLSMTLSTCPSFPSLCYSWRWACLFVC